MITLYPGSGLVKIRLKKKKKLFETRFNWFKLIFFKYIFHMNIY